MLGTLDRAPDQLPCPVEDRLNGLLGLVEQGLRCGSDDAEQPTLVLTLPLLALGGRLLFALVPRPLGLLLPLLVVGRGLLLRRVPLLGDGLQGLRGFRSRLALCAGDQFRLGGRPLAAEAGHLAPRGGAFT